MSEQQMILINHALGETRVAMLRNHRLFNLELISYADKSQSGDICCGKIKSIEKSLNACFIDYGEDKQGFLPFKDLYAPFIDKVDDSETAPETKLKVGQKVLVQVDKEERGNKGAALTQNIALAGSFIVLKPQQPDSSGISRKVGNDKQKSTVKDIMQQVKITDDHSFIIRTAGLKASSEQIQAEVDHLLDAWDKIIKCFQSENKPQLLFHDEDCYLRSVRNFLAYDIEKIITDTQGTYEETKAFVKKHGKEDDIEVVFHDHAVPLFTHFQIEGAIGNLFKREISLPSGGSISIDHTEALTAIDVNSSKGNAEQDIEKTATAVNLEAAKEIANQLRIRDIGGYIVVDFIDMLDKKNRTKVETTLCQELELDRAKIQILPISSLGLLELSRQRIRPSLFESQFTPCSHCHGVGALANIESFTANLLRKVEELMIYHPGSHIQIHVTTDVAVYLTNQSRATLASLEEKHLSTLAIIPQATFTQREYQIKRSASNSPQQDTTAVLYSNDTPFKAPRKRQPRVSRQGGQKRAVKTTSLSQRLSSWWKNLRPAPAKTAKRPARRRPTNRRR